MYILSDPTTNIQKLTCEQLTSAGTRVVLPPHNVGKHNRNSILRDPDGNLVEIGARGGLTFFFHPAKLI
jgi:hypothetical protein